ncbi:MAG: IMP dehydrogenase [Candidatus Sumerlaeia bacterium]|nr:IMP dehydrogenase [Candidatus Sumerlaeia bacterium]
MEANRFTGLTYDDVSLVTQYADFLPRDANTATHLTERIRLNIPFVSAAMDTVTGADMGIAMALAGGLGIVHKNLPPADQRGEIKRIKFYLNGFLAKARTVAPGQTLAEVQTWAAEKGFRFSSFPVLDDERRLLGVITGTHFRYARTLDVPVADVMEREPVTAPPGTTIRQAHEIMLEHRISVLPIVDGDGIFQGLYSFKDVRRILGQGSPNQCVDEAYSLRAGAAVGPSDHERVEVLLETKVDLLVVDTAHGHTKGVLDMVKWIKSRWPEQQIVAGNVASEEGAIALADAGADAVKVGVGPGSICTTRVVAGVGVPQFTAVYLAARALRGRPVGIIADGGIRYSGDVAKALAAGATAVMMGSILAGTDESPGERVLVGGRQYVTYRGMGSLSAMALGSADRYGQKGTSSGKLVPEGVEGLVPYVGPAGAVLDQFSGGLRASMGYCGCPSVNDLQTRARFVRVTEAGKRESHPHDIHFLKDAPNYRTREE